MTDDTRENVLSKLALSLSRATADLGLDDAGRAAVMGTALIEINNQLAGRAVAESLVREIEPDEEIE